MRKNVGGRDRLTRVGVGVALLGLSTVGLGGVPAVESGSGLGLALAICGLLGVAILGSAITQWCPVNALLGRNTYVPTVVSPRRADDDRGRNDERGRGRSDYDSD